MSLLTKERKSGKWGCLRKFSLEFHLEKRHMEGKKELGKSLGGVNMYSR